jgi:hypothetical protein
MDRKPIDRSECYSDAPLKLRLNHSFTRDQRVRTVGLTIEKKIYLYVVQKTRVLEMTRCLHIPAPAAMGRASTPLRFYDLLCYLLSRPGTCDKGQTITCSLGRFGSERVRVDKSLPKLTILAATLSEWRCRVHISLLLLHPFHTRAPNSTVQCSRRSRSHPSVDKLETEALLPLYPPACSLASLPDSY